MGSERMTQINDQFDCPKFSLFRKLMSGLRFFPKTHDFFGFYEKEIDATFKAATLLCEMIEKPDHRLEIAKAIKEQEHVGDEITHTITDLLRETFLTPFDRLDMYNLSKKMDKILDSINFISNRLSRYHVKTMPAQALKLGHIVRDACSILSKMIYDLRSAKNYDKVIACCRDISRLENDADNELSSILDDLYGGKWEAAQTIQVKELVENLEATADRCKGVANIVEGIILKHV